MNATNFIIIVFLPPLAKNAAKKKNFLSRFVVVVKEKEGKLKKESEKPRPTALDPLVEIKKID